MGHDSSMITTVTQKNMVTIPAEVGRKLGIKPGWRLDRQPVEGREEILVRVIPDRGELARRLLGAGRAEPIGSTPVQIGKAAQLAQPVAMARALQTAVIRSRLRLPR